MREIPLTQGQIALVDDEDYDYLNQWKWYACKGRDTFYAMRQTPRIEGRQTSLQMHRIIMEAPTSVQVDHEDHNGLNNQRSNLRLTTPSGNSHNQGKRLNNTTGFKGVTIKKNHLSTPFLAQIGFGGKKKHLGYYTTAEEAARAYDAAALNLHGEFACVNFPTTTKGGTHAKKET
jgi:hypothetical protein